MSRPLWYSGERVGFLILRSRVRVLVCTGLCGYYNGDEDGIWGSNLVMFCTTDTDMALEEAPGLLVYVTSEEAPGLGNGHPWWDKVIRCLAGVR